jgi:hypothetical protein
MKALRTIRRSTLLVFAALAPVVVACSDGFEPPAGLTGTWNSTALVVAGSDLMDEGMTLNFTFSGSGEYSYSVVGDLLDYCDPGPNCADGGDFDITASQITFDPGTVWEETFSYTLTASTLTVSATFDGIPFSFTFEKQ